MRRGAGPDCVTCIEVLENKSLVAFAEFEHSGGFHLSFQVPGPVKLVCGASYGGERQRSHLLRDSDLESMHNAIQ